MILFNRPEEGARTLQLEAENLSFLRSSLEGAGYTTAAVNIDDDIDRLHDAVVVYRPTLIFQLVEHMYNETGHIGAVAGMLDLFGYVYTGSDPNVLVNTQDRARTRILLAESGLPVAPFAVVRDINAIPGLDHIPCPCVVSQAYDDIYDEPADRSLLGSHAEVKEHCRELALEFDLPLLIEHHLPGKRIQACILGNRLLEILPLTERSASNGEDTDNGEIRLADLHADRLGQIRDLAARAYRLLGLRDVGQIDFALGADGEPHIVDVRASVDLFAGAFRIAADHSDWGFEEALAQLAKLCHERLPAGELTHHPLPE